MRREQDLHANSILHSLEKKKVLTGLFLKVHQCNCVHYWLYFRKSHTSPSSQITSSLAVSSSLILVLFNPFRKLLLFLFFGKSPSHPFSSVSRLLAGAAVSPSLSASRTGGGYANSTLSFLNWLIEARMLWRPCLCAALSLFLLLSLSHTDTHTHTHKTGISVPSASRRCISWKKPVSDLVQERKSPYKRLQPMSETTTIFIVFHLQISHLKVL